MKVAYYSDLHLEFQHWEPSLIDADVVILAGDIHVAEKGIEWASKIFKDIPVVYVPGNHEYYCDLNIDQINYALKKKAKGTNVHVLLDESVVINGVNFIGSTLWSDFKLLGDQKLCMALALGMINDYRFIKMATPHMINRKFTPSDALELHKAAILSIDSSINPSMPNVLAVHYGINKLCSHPQFHKDDLSGAFVTDLSERIEIWSEHLAAIVYGHTHHNEEMNISNVPAYSNQRGYAPYDLTPGFKENKTFEVSNK